MVPTGSMHFSAQNALNIVWRPGSARTRWGSLQCYPDPWLDLRGVLLKEGERRRGEGGVREGREGYGGKEGVGRKGEYASAASLPLTGLREDGHP